MRIVRGHSQKKLRIVSLYAIDTMWWIAISTLEKATKLSGNTRASFPLKPIYFPKLRGTVEVDKIRWRWRDNRRFSRGKVENLWGLRSAGCLASRQRLSLPSLPRLHNRAEWNREYIHTHVYVYVYTRTCHQNLSDLRHLLHTLPIFPVSHQSLVKHYLSPIRQDGYLMLDIFFSLSSLLDHCTLLF